MKQLILIIVCLMSQQVAQASNAQLTAKNEATSPDSRTVTRSEDVAGVKTILFIGDSLTAGYGVKKEESFPEKVQGLLNARGRKVKVINGGISGSVTAEADRRVKWYLRSKPDVLVLALGANDGLKGTPPGVIKKNLAQAIDLAQSNGIKVVLVGIRVFSNLGESYTKEFEGVYRELAKEKKVAFVPFLLEGVALKPELNQPDGKHPNARGHEIIAQNMARELEKVL